mgnify:CR=1 FL=1
MKFMKLSPEEQKEFRKWASDNYTPFSPIQGIWHPEIQKQCVAINIINSEFVDENQETPA